MVVGADGHVGTQESLAKNADEKTSVAEGLSVGESEAHRVRRDHAWQDRDETETRLERNLEINTKTENKFILGFETETRPILL